MKTLNASHLFPSEASASRFASARALAYSMAESDDEMLEPELIAWQDHTSSLASPVLEGCGGPDGWRHYGISHGGRLEVDVNGVATFIFAESSPYDSYVHFAPGPYINVRDSQGTELICLAGGTACVPLDDWTSKLT